MDYIDSIVNIFQEEYKKSRGVEYHSTLKDRRMAGLLQKLYKNKDKNTEESLKDFRIFFIKCLDINDKWYYENMTLSLIYSKINEVKQRIQNATNRNSIPEVKSKQFANRYTERYSKLGY